MLKSYLCFGFFCKVHNDNYYFTMSSFISIGVVDECKMPYYYARNPFKQHHTYIVVYIRHIRTTLAHCFFIASVPKV